MEEVFSYKINHNFKWSIRAKTKYRTYIDKILSIWGPPTIIAWQRDSLMKFWTRQYVGHGQKQTFFGRSLLIKNMPYLKFMATYATSNTTQQYIHALITQRHNTTIWKLWRLLISNKISRHYTLMNVGTYIGLHKKTQCRRCYYHAHVMLKDAIKMPSLHLTYYAS